MKSPGLIPGEDLVIADAVRSPLGACRHDDALAAVRTEVLLAHTAAALLDRIVLEPAAVTKVVIAGGPGLARVARDTASLMGIAPYAAVETTDDLHGSALLNIARSVGRRDVALVLATSTSAARSPEMSSSEMLRAELVAARWRLGRDELDAYAARSCRRAHEVEAMGEFAPEIIPAVAWSRGSRIVITADQTISGSYDDHTSHRGSPGLASRRPYVGWHLHPGHVSRPAIGAAATLLVGSGRALELGIRPRARILALAESTDPLSSDGCGPIQASRTVFEHTGIDPDDLDHYEVSEAYSSIPLAWCREFEADLDRFNPRGGSIGLGRPGPASELRSLATMLSALDATGGSLGLHATEGHDGRGEAVLVEFLHRSCCARDVLGADLRHRRIRPLEPLGRSEVLHVAG